MPSVPRAASTPASAMISAASRQRPDLRFIQEIVPGCHGRRNWTMVLAAYRRSVRSREQIVQELGHFGVAQHADMAVIESVDARRAALRRRQELARHGDALIV